MIIWIYNILFLLLHPYHVSVTIIDYNESEKKMEIIIYTFPDDLELAVKKRFNKDIRIDTKENLSGMLIEAYLLENFSLKINDKKTEIDFAGYTFEGEKLLLLLESNSVEKPNKILVYNNLQNNVYGDQTNIVHVNCCRKRFTEILSKENVQTLFLLNEN